MKSKVIKDREDVERGKTMKVLGDWYTVGMGAIFAVCCALYGMYYEFCGAVMTVVLATLLGFSLLCNRTIFLKLNLGIIISAVLLVFYSIASVYAVDSGMAFLGIFKYSWIFLFLLCYGNLKQQDKERIVNSIPYIGMVMCLLGVFSFFVDELYSVFYVNDRLGGCFQYPNTFALFLLVGVIVLCREKKMNKSRIFVLLCLLSGIFLTGSRMVLVLTGGVILFLIWTNRNQILLVCTIGITLLAVGYFLLTKDVENIGRITTFSLTDSSLVGRFLYIWDAVPLLLDHPFGLGHMGYYYMQNMIQSGVYTVQYVHNDWLQIGLDVGLVPMLLCLFAVLKTLLDKRLHTSKKLIVAVIFLHGCLDFNLSYGVMLCILLMIMEGVTLQNVETESNKVIVLCGGRKIAMVVILAMAGIVSIYSLVPTVAYYNENAELALQWYPWHTEAKLLLLSDSEDLEEVERLAEDIMKQNDTCALAYYAKAMVAYCEDDYEKVIQYQKGAIERNYFSYEEYMNYAVMLYDGVMMSDNQEVREQCISELNSIPQYMEMAMERLSTMGGMINDQPNLYMDEMLESVLYEVNVQQNDISNYR